MNQFLRCRGGGRNLVLSPQTTAALGETQLSLSWAEKEAREAEKEEEEPWPGVDSERGVGLSTNRDAAFRNNSDILRQNKREC